uniref:hypothetical protein n=1 Tax=Marinobacterium profundum TaxID=1714300 RepID=UPI00082E49B4|nr:hypothetical protein [Marinobacterium profundum]
MHHPLPRDVIDRIAKEEQHFAHAPEAFFQAWKRGVVLAGPQWFGDGTHEGLQRATSEWELRPNIQALIDALSVLNHGQRLFLSAMVSFYNTTEGNAMLRRCGFQGLPALGGLDLQQRQVLADLLLNYRGG